MSFLLWGVWWPLLALVRFCIFWVPEIVQRRKFEERNQLEMLSTSFKQDHVVADLCFEFSSEGEYQQVAALIDDALACGKKIELVFFSPSVEKSVLELAQKYPTQLRYLRFPLVTFSYFGQTRSFTRWVSAKTLVLVRYDLFPELLWWARNEEHELIMVWTSFKKERVKGKSISRMKKAFLKSASKLIYASVPDAQMGKDLGRVGPVYDFRIEQIRRRIEKRQEKFANTFSQYERLEQLFTQWPREKRLIIGNAWPSDLPLLELLPEDYFVLVVPHQLTPEIVREFDRGLERLGRSPVELKEGVEILEGDTFILNKKGVLCELYADFGLAYVGGGFEASVHSILEPLVAGVPRLGTGPKTERSTEFDVAQTAGVITELKNAEDFGLWLAGEDKLDNNKFELKDVFDRYEQLRKEVISC